MSRSRTTPLFNRLGDHPGLAALTVAVSAATVLGGCSTSTEEKRSPSTPVRNLAATVGAMSTSPEGARPSCGLAAPATLATTAGDVAMKIYAHELLGTGVRADQRQVESYRPLLSALASGNRFAVRRAVTSLVYSHTHIVRLQVTQNAAVLADVGGPYIIAPVAGTLRFHGRTIGRYLMSVQDDLGYVKLETRYVGLPLVLQMGARRLPLEGTLVPGPASIPNLGPVSYRGTSYEVFSFSALTFPRGRVRISLLVPLSESIQGQSCVAVRLDELGHIAHLVWDRYAFVSAPSAAYVNQVHSLTGGLSYVRTNARQLAGSTTPGPSHLPNRGTVTYRGAKWDVSSFASRVAVGPVRVYVLVG